MRTTFPYLLLSAFLLLGPAVSDAPARSASAKPGAKSAAAFAKRAKTVAKANSAAKTAAKADSAMKMVVVSAPKTTLRAKPDRAAKAVALLTQFTPVEAIGSDGSWKKVRTLGGATGYVAGADLARGPFVSTQSPVKVRSGPAGDDVALFSLQSGYPLRVLDKKGNRVQVKDYEGDSGWAHEKYLSIKNYVIAKEKTINLREGPGAQYPKRFVADKGAAFEVIEEKNGWLRLKYSDGDEGWCSAKIVWGWLPE
jgi:SH3-like domain-containing protein